MTKNTTPPSDISPTALFQGLDLDDGEEIGGESPHVTFAATADDIALPSGGENMMTDEDPVELGVRVAHIVDPSRLCMGYIGRTKTKFCILAKGKCTVHSHTLRPCEDIAPGLYCLDATGTGVNAGVCLTVPTVPKDLLQDSEFLALMTETNDLEQLQTQFSIVGMREGPGEAESADAVTTTLLAQVDEYKTPKKEKLSIMREGPDGDHKFTMRGGESFKGAVDGFWSKLKGFENTIGPAKLEVDYVQEQGRHWAYDISQIKDYLRKQGRILDSFAHTVSDKLMLVEGLVHKTKTIESKIGNQSDLLKRHGTEPVLWNAIAGIVDSGTTAMMDHERLKQISTTTDSKVSAMQGELQSILKSFKTKIDSNSQSLRAVTHEITNFKNSVHTAKSGSVSSGDATGKGSGQVGSSLLGLSFLDDNPEPPKTSTQEISNSKQGDQAHQSADKLNKSDLWTTMKLVDSLEDRLEALEVYKQGQDEKMLEEAVKLMDVVFTGKDDVERWYCNCTSDSDGIPPCGLFVDPLIALFWIGTRIDGGGASRTKLDILLKGKKLDMSELEMGAYESFDSDIPTIFLGENKEKTVITDEDKSKLANLPTFKAWHHPGREKGLSQQIRSAAKLVKGALHNAITDTFLRKNEKLYSMALEMLETSFEFVSQLSNYITNTFIDFRELEVGSEKDVWNLITFVVEHLFKNDFAKARQLSITRLNAGDRDSAFVVMWCSLRSVAVAKSLSSVGISDSPAVSASYVRFVLTQSNRGKIAAVEEENKLLRKELDSLKADVAAIKTQAKEAKRTADSAMSKVNKKPKVGDDKKA